MDSLPALQRPASAQPLSRGGGTTTRKRPPPARREQSRPSSAGGILRNSGIYADHPGMSEQMRIKYLTEQLWDPGINML